MEKKFETLSQIQTYCMIAVVVVNVLPHGHAIDAQHAQHAALFRLAISLLGLAAWVVLAIKQQRIKKAEREPVSGVIPPAGTWPPPPQA